MTPHGTPDESPLDARLAELLTATRSDLAVMLAATSSGDFEVVVAAGGEPVPPAGLLVLGGGDSICGFAALQHGAVIYENVSATARFSGARMTTTFGAVSSLVVAIRSQGAVVGVLGVHSRMARSFAAAEARLLERAADGLSEQFDSCRIRVRD